MEGRRKEIMLLLLAVVALGVGFYTFRKPAPPPAPTAARPEGTKPGKEAAEPSAVGPQGAPVGPGATTTAGEQRNPFAAPSEGAPTQPTPKTGEPAAAGPPPAGGEPAPTPAPSTQPAPNEPEKPTLTLTGVVRGRPDVAILRQDDRRYFVKVGETVGDYRVLTILSQQVVLAGPSGKVTLRMGGRQ